jgi:hypothetical protein
MKRTLAAVAMAAFVRNYAGPALAIGGTTAACVVAGCAGQTPVQTLSHTRGTASAIVGGITTARQMNKISDDDYNRIVHPHVNEADRTFDEWEAAINSGQPVTINYLSVIQAALDRLKAYLIAKETKP